MKTVTLPVKGLNFAGCAREIEKNLGKHEPIKQVEASYISQTATITYDETRLSEAQLREMLKDCGFACGEALTYPDHHEATYRATSSSTMLHTAGHGPSTIAPVAEAGAPQSTTAQPAMEHRAHAEAPEKMDMGGMDHDMIIQPWHGRWKLICATASSCPSC